MYALASQYANRNSFSMKRSEGFSRGGTRVVTRGFTLIEILAVLTIIAVLLTIAVPRYFNSIDRTKEVTLRHDLNVMRDAIDKFYGDTGALPETLNDLIVKKYLRAIPVDPITGSAATWQIIPPLDPKLTGVHDIKSGAQGTAMDGSKFQDW